MDRRSFINWVGVSLLAHSLPVAFTACSRQNASDSSSFRAISTLAQLDKDGFILNQEQEDAPILVVRDLANPDQIVAVNANCTHRKCLINWERDKNIFQCGCHNSKFSLTGKVLSSPADEPLTVYSVKLEADRIFVSYSPTKK